MPWEGDLLFVTEGCDLFKYLNFNTAHTPTPMNTFPFRSFFLKDTISRLNLFHVRIFSSPTRLLDDWLKETKRQYKATTACSQTVQWTTVFTSPNFRLSQSSRSLNRIDISPRKCVTSVLMLNYSVSVLRYLLKPAYVPRTSTYLWRVPLLLSSGAGRSKGIRDSPPWSARCRFNVFCTPERMVRPHWLVSIWCQAQDTDQEAHMISYGRQVACMD